MAGELKFENGASSYVMPCTLKDSIKNCLELHPDWGYKRVAKQVGCSPNLVRYHTDPLEVQRNRSRKKDYFKNLNGVLKRKKDNFQCIGPRIRQSAISGRKSAGRVPSAFTAEELREKLESNPRCYLTGRSVDLLAPATYQLDHIHPASRGGTNELDNCGLVCKPANMAKGNMLHSEFLELCREVLEHHGFTVKRG